MEEYSKPLPHPTPESLPFWQGCQKHELLIPHCRNCGAYHFYPRFFCPHCTSTDLEWVKSTGRGMIHTFTVIERAGTAAFAKDVPYVLAIIQLEENVYMLSNLVECDPDRIKIGMGVEVVFDDVSPEITLPKFRPSKVLGVTLRDG